MTDAGFDFSSLSEFRDRLQMGSLKQKLLDEFMNCWNFAYDSAGHLQDAFALLISGNSLS